MKNVCNESIFNQLFRELSESLYAFIYHKFGSEHNPEDMVQEAFIALWNNCQKVAPDKAKSYLYTVARNMTLKGIEKMASANKYRSSIEKDRLDSTPHDQLEEKEFGNRLNNALNELPEKQRIAFILNKVEGKKHKEIAEMLDISQKAVEKRIYTAAAYLLKKTGKKI